ncbi:arginine biosynthesis bifunctional protein ArgJ, chloroplastic isoform X1 [Sesamum indicum]|uniref:Arginine biosynthesis bifunctional protein ArgJ, chloroplastic n=2 Tax=Sesamum indicum TaxID=4182 RepID=A0A6I9UAJ2_SESIN|nr:arginine biosynthesis bifunctional protein ArgJ, chloroplastic isoform X1 [Sesamum indicum]XP_020553546.1 arginine biosynthesis bifunctional protein ArgJ, chloroplastic isoform X1 [Sesamum indicum]
MSLFVPHYVCIKFSYPNKYKIFHSAQHSRMNTSRVSAVVSAQQDVSNYIPAAPILLPEGPWHQVPGGVAAAKGFKAAGMYGGLRAVGEKPDLALVTCDVDAISAGAFTTNVVAAAPVLYCKEALETSTTARAILINAGQANAATGDAGYQDVIDCSHALAELLQLKPEQVLIESTGVIGQRIKKEPLLKSLPDLVNLLSSTVQGADSAAVAITTTDLVSKSIAIESEVGGTRVRVGGMAKGSGMIHPNMATMLGVITTDALVTSDVWRKMVRVAVNRSFNQITVDGDTSTNDCVIALASGLSGANKISSLNNSDAEHLQACLDAVMQGLAKSIAWDGEGATCLIEVKVSGAGTEADAAKVARSVASSSLTKAAVYGRDPNWGRIACAAGYAGIPFNPNKLRISLGDILLMESGQPLPFDRAAASNYLRTTGEKHGTVIIQISIGDGLGSGQAWGCDLSYDYVKINAEYTT